MVAQVGGDVDVDVGGGQVVEPEVPGSPADRDPAYGTLRSPARDARRGSAGTRRPAWESASVVAGNTAEAPRPGARRAGVGELITS